MKWLDHYLQEQRFKRALKHIPEDSTVLDIGCYHGEFFEMNHQHLAMGVGIDKCLSQNVSEKNYSLISGSFPEAAPPADQTFDVITLIATLEHIPKDRLHDFSAAVSARLKPGGKLIITVPSPWVDPLLDLLKALKLIDGMDTDEHYGFKPQHTAHFFGEKNFKLNCHKRFQFGLNNLFVFERID